MFRINDDKRKNPMLSTNKCWKCDPDERPDICEVILVLNSIDPIKSENNKLQMNFDSKENKKGALTKELEEHDLSNYNINFSKYSHL
ncbi:kinase-like domain-containing protein [Rhizophagus clarus]|uniref:Kinase-like domain-containing protein n=1 Tax=Rhizophagus clarus TaxID=94130 RepID=A0A8H3KVV9_9GLOM|nr:kinase-like domain-containing protein [Rhizophagus clarus]